MSSFFAELKRRNVFRVGGAYAVVAWLIMQVANTFFPALHLPEWTVTFVAVLLIIGFPIAVFLAWAYELTQEGIARTKDIPLEQSVNGPGGHGVILATMGLLAIAVFFIVVHNKRYFDDVIKSHSTGDAPAGQAVASSFEHFSSFDTRPRIVVLPCENLSDNKDDAYLAMGIHGAIVDQLFKLHNLLVIGADSVAQYAKNSRPISAIAAEFDAKAVMTCRVQFGGGNFLVSALLTDPGTGATIWSGSYPGDRSDAREMFESQADIAMNLANALNAEYSNVEQEWIERVETTSGKAYTLYLSASVGDNPLAKRLELLDQAIEIDPEFASAYALKAWLLSQSLTSTFLAGEADPQTSSRIEAQIIDLSDKALKWEPGSMRALGALANMYFYTWRWDLARESFDRVLRFGDIDLRTFIYLYIYLGDYDRALKLARENVARNPRQQFRYAVLGYAQLHAGDIGAARESFQKALDLPDGPNSMVVRDWLAQVELVAGNYDAVFELVQVIDKQHNGTNPFLLLSGAYMYHLIDRQDDAERLVVTDLKRTGGRAKWLHYLIRGDNENALRKLNETASRVARHEPDPDFYVTLNFAKVNLLRNPILDRPDFVDVRNRLNAK